MLHELGNVRYIPLKYDGQKSEASALELIHTLIPEWTSDDSNVDFIRFTDGITNTLLKAINRKPGLTKSEIDRDAVLLRAYGSGTAILIDREREAANHELLMRYDLAPELLARFENGMLYRFIPGAVASPTDLGDPSVCKAVARRLAEWHARVPCLHGPSPSTNGGKRNGQSNGDREDPSSDPAILNAAPGKPYPNLWTTMQKWILALPTDTEEKRKRQSLLQQEFEEIVKNLSQRPGFGHNGVCTCLVSPPPL